MKIFIWVVIIALILVGAFYALNNYIYNEKQADMDMTKKELTIYPIEHASLAMDWAGQTIVVDPVGEVSLYAGHAAPNLILLTDIHGDHLAPETILSLVNQDTRIFAPQAVADELPENLKGITTVMANDQSMNFAGINVLAVPMYNVPEAEDAYHTKGRGNGYILEYENKRVYIAGDTGPTPEMKSLQNIDTAFIPMNLPYTMNVEDAAEAVLAFKPKKVIPYHYRTPDGFSDVNKFKELVNAGDPNIEVQLLKWY